MRIWTSEILYLRLDVLLLIGVSRVSYIPNALSSGDEGPLKKKDILKNTGNLLRIRQHIYLQEENLIDPPEMFWSNASLESTSGLLTLSGSNLLTSFCTPGRMVQRDGKSS